VIETPRLTLRDWREADREPFAAMNADPAVMEFFPATQPRAASDAMIDRWRAQLAREGWSNWAVERRDTGEFAGFVGLTRPVRDLPFTPCVEVGWRLAPAYWGRGFAAEAARAALEHGFASGLAEIVSYTAKVNLRSRAVMERIGMRDAGEDFAHPALPEGHVLEPHCLYRLSAADWGRRRLRLADYEPAMATELVAMWRESFEEAVRTLDPHPISEQHRYFEEEVLPGNTVKVLLEGDRVAGFIAASRDSIAQLYVRRGRQRRGLGSWMLEWARSQSGGSLWLHTFARNERACAFYERHGFRVAARGFEPHWGLEDVRYEWRRAG
jgi:RimJ/RimL family protein N-acetyltransferase